MRPIPALLVVLTLTGCAAPPPMVNASSREPVCAKGCLQVYSQCLSGLGIPSNAIGFCVVNHRHCLLICQAK